MNFLEKYAGWLVLVAWLLVAGVVFEAAVFGVNAVISVSYHPLHPLAPILGLVVKITVIAFFAGLAVAIYASVALAMRKRRHAGAAVATVWGIILLGSAATFALTGRGPESFDRYVGGQLFRIPWEYQPGGKADPAHDGFLVDLCLDTLRGSYDESCRSGRSMQVGSRAAGRPMAFDEPFFLKHLPEMERRPPEYGHEVLARHWSSTNVNGFTTHSVKLYFAIYDDARNVVRLARCSETVDTCRSFVRIGDFAISYDSDRATLSRWEEMDQTLFQLVESWRAEQPG